MHDPSRPPSDASGPPTDPPIMTLVSAGLFLYIGFGLGLVGVSGDALHDGSVTLFVWMARIVGIGLIAVFLLNLTRQPAGLLLDLGLSALATVGCALAGLIWLAYGQLNGFLLLLFTLVNASATRVAWLAWRSRGA